MKRVPLYIIILVLVFSLPACRATLFENPVCDPPCWQGIIPGETDKSELLRILNELPIVIQDSVTVIESPDLLNDEFIFTLSSGTKVYVTSLNDKVAQIFFYQNIGLSFSEAITYFGEPETIFTIVHLCSPVFLFGDGLCTYIQAQNFENGVAFGYDIRFSERQELEPDVHIDSVMFLDTDHLQELLDAGLVYQGLDAEDAIDNLLPWTGYGEIPEK